MLLALGDPFNLWTNSGKLNLFSCLVGAGVGQELYHLLSLVPAQVDGRNTLQQCAVWW